MSPPGPEPRLETEVVMGVNFQVPCEDGQMVDVEIDKDLDLVFCDYDIVRDLAAMEFGYSATFCSQIVEMVKTAPMTFICGSGLFPITGLGIVSCVLAKDALETIVLKEEPFSCFDEARKLIDISLKNWYPKTTAIKRLHHARQALTRCWNSEITKRRGDYHEQRMPSVASQKIVEAAEGCAGFVTDFWATMELTSRFKKYPQHPCEITMASRLAVADVLYRKISEERNRFYGVSFKELLDHPPDDLAVLLYDIERGQAKMAVKILEAV